MMRSLNSKSGTPDKCGAVRKHIARSLIGQAVELLVGGHTIIHGVVTNVATEAGTPKLVVGGARYDLSQILTTMPASLDRQLHSVS
jgi:hypothetical protein